MTRQELEAWGLVGAGAIIIVLLLLEYPGAAAPQQVVQETINPGPAGNYPINVHIDNTPLPPWSINFPPLGNETINLLFAPPCSCACEGAETISTENLSGSIDALNEMLKNGTINSAQSYFAGIPYQDLFATNATGIAAFTTGVGLPVPINTQPVVTPASTDLVGGGSLSYSYQTANPFGG